MLRSSLSAVVCALALLAVGCGTVNNFRHGPPPGEPRACKVFGGVREDFEFITQDYDAFRPMIPLIGTIDLPLSFVADVVTLPWTIKATRERNARNLQ